MLNEGPKEVVSTGSPEPEEGIHGSSSDPYLWIRQEPDQGLETGVVQVGNAEGRGLTDLRIGR
jgi:hypothetical protein